MIGRDAPIDDALLTWLALAADPDAAVPDDAVPIDELFGRAAVTADGLLPAWYMPPPATGTGPRARWRRRVGVGLIGTLVLINAAGLCSTYGWVAIA